eukprot:4853469-Alexandrium_andersonii.AAC.1
MLSAVQGKVVEAKKMFHKTTPDKNKYAGAIHEDTSNVSNWEVFGDFVGSSVWVVCGWDVR